MTLEIHNRRRWGALTVVGEDHCAGRVIPVPVARLRAGRATTVGYPVPTDGPCGDLLRAQMHHRR